ncbi:uncharacterized protein LOC115217429 [Argonauta hians]
MCAPERWANCCYRWRANVKLFKKININDTASAFSSQSCYFSTKFGRSSIKRSSNTQTSTLHEIRADLKEKKTSPSYIFDEDVADKVATKIIEERQLKNVPIIEYNPGPGLLTKKLFEKGAKSVIGIEAKSVFEPYLKKTQSFVGKKRFKYHFWDPFMNVVLDSKRMSYLHTKEGESFQDIKQKSWEAGPYASIFGIVNPHKSRYFISLLINCLGTKESIYSLGRPELFLMIPARTYRTLSLKFPNTNYLSYRRTSSALNLFFDSELLLEFKVSDVFPLFSVPRKFLNHSSSFVTVNKDSVYFVKIFPKKLVNTIPSPELYSKFLTFLNQVLQKRSSRLIPKMESWLPGSGIHLIRMGYTMMHLIGELSPEQFLDIFLELQSWAEYPESSLQAILNNAAPNSDKEVGDEFIEETN